MSQDYVFVCKKCGDEIEIKYEPKEQEPFAWMPVIGFENQYQVSNTGDIKNVKSGKILAKSIMGAGYYKADLWSFGKRRQTSIHRVVASAFLGVPIDGMEINHKDGNKLNNHVSNLEWVTRSKNVQHSYDELKNRIKPVKAISLKTGEVRIYSSIAKTAVDGFEPKNVSEVCRRKDRYTHKGWSFSFYEPTPQLKELSDEEIMDVWCNTVHPKEFAKAILKKASEK